jgi:hypothetical protein
MTMVGLSISGIADIDALFTGRPAASRTTPRILRAGEREPLSEMSMPLTSTPGGRSMARAFLGSVSPP